MSGVDEPQTPMKVIDTHTHTWGRDTDELPWREAALPPGRDGEYTHGDLVADMDRVGVDEAVVVTTPLYGWGRRANEYTMRSIEAHPERLYGVGIVDFDTEPETAASDVRRVVGHERMVGVRMHPALAHEDILEGYDVDPEWMLDDAAAPVWETLADLETAAFVIPKPTQLSLLERVAGAHPSVSFVVEHMGWPDGSVAPDEPPWNDAADLAEHDNVYVKVSSLPRSSTESWPYADLHGHVRALLEWFGPERLLLGSDYPWMSDWADYEECLSWVDAVEFLSRRDRAYLSYRTFRELLRE